MGDIFDSLSQTSLACDEALNSLRDYAKSAPSSSNSPPLPTILQDFRSNLTFIYGHSTTLSLALKPPANSEAAVKPLSDLTADVTRLVVCGLLLKPGEHGGTLRREVVWAAQEVIEATKELVSSFTSSNGPSRALKVGDKTYLMKMGSLHSSVERIRGDLSNNNVKAVIKAWKANAAALKDAIRETKEMTEDEDLTSTVDDGWDEIGEGLENVKMTAEELQRTKKIHHLLRLVSLFHGRIQTHYLTTISLATSDAERPNNDLLDKLLKHSSDIASSGDDLVASLYSPQEHEEVLSKAHVCVGFTSALRHSLRYKPSDDDDIADQMASIAITADDTVSEEAELHLIAGLDKTEWKMMSSYLAQIVRAWRVLG